MCSDSWTPKEASLVAASGGYADGVSDTQTDAAGETFRLVTEGKVLVDAAAAAIVLDTWVMSNASGDAITYVPGAGNKALGVAEDAASGGAGEQIIVRLFKTPLPETTEA